MGNYIREINIWVVDLRALGVVIWWYWDIFDVIWIHEYSLLGGRGNLG